MIAIEYSFSQRAFHVSELSDVVKANLTNMLQCKETDYLLIGVVENRPQASDFIDEVKKRMAS